MRAQPKKCEKILVNFFTSGNVSGLPAENRFNEPREFVSLALFLATLV